MILAGRLLGGAALVLALAGCSAGGDMASSPPATTAPAAPTDYGEEPTVLPTLPTSDAASLESARLRGGEALARYLRPDAAPDAWLDELRPYLAPEAVGVVSISGPASLPHVDVHADRATIADGATAFTAIVLVPTSGGEWAVSMRRDDGGEWLVAFFQAPAAGSGGVPDAPPATSGAGESGGAPDASGESGAVAEALLGVAEALRADPPASRPGARRA